MRLRFRPASRAVKSAFAYGLARASYLGGQYSPQHDYHVVGYSLSLKHLEAISTQDQRGIDHVAKPVGWQCFASSNAGPRNAAVVAEVSPVYKAPRQSARFAGPLRMTSLFYSETVNKSYQKALEMHDKYVTNEKSAPMYEPRLLRIPGLLITAFWMKSVDKSRKEDLVIPIHHALQLKEYYPLSEFLREVKRLAKERLRNTVQEESSAQDQDPG